MPGAILPDVQALVAKVVRGLGLEPRLGTTVSSVVATIEGNGPGMDGLPLTEETGLTFSSEVAVALRHLGGG